MSTARPALQSKSGKSKVPDVTKQSDRHTQIGALILSAEQAPDSLERMLAICRVLLCWLTDLLRAGRGFQDTPVLTLGYHALSHRELGQKYKGDAVRVYLQEGVSYEKGYGPTQPSKYNDPANVELATFELSFKPVCLVQAQRGGLLGGGGAAFVECSWEGCMGQLYFPRHDELYRFTLPSLLLTDPLAQDGMLDFGGGMEVDCPATGLQARLKFKPHRSSAQRTQHGAHPAVKGQVSRLQGEGLVAVAMVRGDWGGVVEVEGAGVLFDASHCNPPHQPTLNAAKPSPRALPRLWAALLQQMTSVDAVQAARQGKRAEQLAQQLPSHLQDALGYQTEGGGKASGARAGGGEGTPSPAAPRRHVAPCLEAQARAGGRPAYFLQYTLQAVPM